MPTTTLDATLGCVMPVDVEGFEDRVLRGMSAILSRWRPAIVVECNPDGPHRQVEQILGDELYVFYHLGPHGPERKPRPGTIKPILGKRGEPSSWLKPDGGRIIQTSLRFRVLPSPQEQE